MPDGSHEVLESFKRQWRRHHRGSVDVPCLPTSDLLANAKITHVDFFSLDVEGAALTVIETLDFKTVSIDVFVIKLDAHDPPKNWKIRRMLHNRGYKECKLDTGKRNGWFVHKRSGLLCTKG